MRFWRLVSLAALAFLLATAGVSRAANTAVWYRLFHLEGGVWVEYSELHGFPPGGDQPGTNTWKYEYTVQNLGFTGTGINTWYAFFNSDNLPCASTTGNAAIAPLNWTTQQQGPVLPNYNWKERFRTLLSGSYITMGTQREGFSVQFNWTCNRLPGRQNYDAVTSGGSESSVTQPVLPTPVENVTWGAVKAIYR